MTAFMGLCVYHAVFIVFGSAFTGWSAVCFQMVMYPFLCASRNVSAFSGFLLPSRSIHWVFILFQSTTRALCASCPLCLGSLMCAVLVVEVLPCLGLQLRMEGKYPDSLPLSGPGGRSLFDCFGLTKDSMFFIDCTVITLDSVICITETFPTSAMFSQVRVCFIEV